MEKSEFAFPPLGEFQLIEKILSRNTVLDQTSPQNRFWLPAGDDAAAFDGWLIAQDLSVENTHFRLDWGTPEQAVRKCIVSNISDISAMGGTPRFALLGLCLNRLWNDEIQARIAKAFADEFLKRGITVLGGDTVSGDCGLFSVTLIGTTPKPLYRSAAKTGDFVYVTGDFGRSRAGLWLLEHAQTMDFPDLVEAHLSPEIYEGMGAWLALKSCAHACIDVSDGLASELNHLALSSSVKLLIEEEKIPVSSRVLEFFTQNNLFFRDFILNGGEEYQLLFTSPFSESIFYKMQTPFPITCIGTVGEGSGVWLREKNGIIQELKAESWSHL